MHWRIEVLRQSRQQTAEELEDRRRELSHLEDVIRDLEQELQQVIAEARQLQQQDVPQPTDLRIAQQKIEQLRQQLDQQRKAMEAARARLETEKPSYAIVPYDGPHSTRRRPVFVECLKDRIVLQPEGIELRGDDFREPITDDNPLASALRAKREYLADLLQNRDGHPYPLLIVRPDGARAYAAARAAMKSWEAEFGYELIEADLTLQYPPVDTALVNLMQRAVDQARARRTYLQSIAPARFGRTESVLRPSSRGGFESVGGGTSSYDGDSMAAGPHAADSTWPGGAETTDDWTPTPSGRSPSDRPPRSDTTQGRSSGPAIEGRNGPAEASPQPGKTEGKPGGNSSSPGVPVSGPYQPNLPASQEHAMSRRPPGGRASSATQMSESATDGPGGPMATGSAGGTSPGPGGATSTPSLTGMNSLSAERGADWALPESAAAATGVTRPIRIACYADRLVILPEDHRREEPEVLPIVGSAREEVDDLVTRIWERMKTWGIAGPGMYWRPVLIAEIRRDGELRFAELHRLMENSGIVVKRK